MVTYPPTGKFTVSSPLLSLICFRIERIPNPLLTMFLDILYEQRGDFLVKVSHSISEHIRDILHGKEVGMKYTFENMDKMALKQEPLDSPEFVRFCEIE